MIQLTNTVPWAQPDARWQKGCQIVERGGYTTRRRDGELVQRLVRCVRLLDRARTDKAVRRAALEFPDIFWALRLQQENSTRVLELKARVLAGQPDREIASLLGVPERTIATYLALFFDVRPRLKASSWIVHVAIGAPLGQPPSVETLLLLHAWRRGPFVVEAWLDYLAHQQERHDLDTEVGRRRAWLELLIQVQQLPFEAQTLQTLWKLSPIFLGKPCEVIKSTTVRTTILQNRASVLAEIAWQKPDEREFGESPFPTKAKENVSRGEEPKLSLVG